MGRGRGKGKKLTVTNNDDESGEEEKIPAQKRRGRPQKLLKDEMDEEGSEKIELENSDDTKTGSSNKESKSSSVDNVKKRRRNSLPKEKIDSGKEENGNGTLSASGEPVKYNGFRSNGNRRKSKPRQAAEAVVECQ